MSEDKINAVLRRISRAQAQKPQGKALARELYLLEETLKQIYLPQNYKDTLISMLRSKADRFH